MGRGDLLEFQRRFPDWFSAISRYQEFMIVGAFPNHSKPIILRFWGNIWAVRLFIFFSIMKELWIFYLNILAQY